MVLVGKKVREYFFFTILICSVYTGGVNNQWNTPDRIFFFQRRKKNLLKCKILKTLFSFLVWINVIAYLRFIILCGLTGEKLIWMNILIYMDKYFKTMTSHKHHLHSVFSGCHLPEFSLQKRIFSKFQKNEAGLWLFNKISIFLLWYWMSVL